jgi:hypothetical protein
VITERVSGLEMVLIWENGSYTNELFQSNIPICNKGCELETEISKGEKSKTRIFLPTDKIVFDRSDSLLIWRLNLSASVYDSVFVFEQVTSVPKNLWSCKSGFFRFYKRIRKFISLLNSYYNRTRNVRVMLYWGMGQT